MQISGGAGLSQSVLELSPLNRLLQQGAPGAAWQVGAGHTTSMQYLANNNVAAGQTGGRRAALYTVSIAFDGARTLVRAGNNAVYATNKLEVTAVTDENGSLTEEYKDNAGQVVLKRSYNVKNGQTEVLSTYYVYDDLGYLSFVLPPGVNPDADAAISQATLDNYVYQYIYDERGRVAAKKLPGKGWEYLVYNKLDQVVATQDANQRALSEPQWSFMKYDAAGRAVGSTPEIVSIAFPY